MGDDPTQAYRTYGRALVRKAERILGTRDDALDVVHGLFADLVERPDDKPLDLPYLYRAVTNRCLTLLRDEKNRARLLQENDAALRGPVRTRLDDQLVDGDLLMKLVARLEPIESEILVAHVFDDMSQEEIAALVSLSRKTVGKKLEKIAELAREVAKSPSSSRLEASP
jgi:RNA polymerase sigma-70 factor (ECF subfamily)